MARLTRRHMIGGLGGLALGLPLLPSLLPRSARAQSLSGPKRLLFIYTHNHQPSQAWLPTGGETDFVLSPILTPLAPYRDKMLVLHNLTGASNDHPGGAHVLDEADGTAPSIDQIVTQHLGNATRLRSLELATFSSGASLSYSASGVRLPPMEHPLSAFARVAGAVTGDPNAEAIAARQTGTIVDAVMRRYASLSARLSTSERRLVDAHLDQLRDLHVRVSNPAMVRACSVPSEPDVPSGAASVRDETLFPAVCRAHLDIIATAFTCDATRVASLMLGSGGSLVRYSWLGIDDVAHDLAHGFRNADRSDIEGAAREWVRVQVWHAEQIAYLLAKLDAVVEGDRTLLDNTVVYWVSELGLGQEHGTHSRQNLPALLIGSGGDYLRTGRFLDLGGRPHADLLLTLAHAMGFEDLATFGADGTAPLELLRR
jgi:hypothetical protein